MPTLPNFLPLSKPTTSSGITEKATDNGFTRYFCAPRSSSLLPLHLVCHHLPVFWLICWLILRVLEFPGKHTYVPSVSPRLLRFLSFLLFLPASTRPTATTPNYLHCFPIHSFSLSNHVFSIPNNHHSRNGKGHNSWSRICSVFYRQRQLHHWRFDSIRRRCGDGQAMQMRVGHMACTTHRCSCPGDRQGHLREIQKTSSRNRIAAAAQHDALIPSAHSRRRQHERSGRRK